MMYGFDVDSGDISDNFRFGDDKSLLLQFLIGLSSQCELAGIVVTGDDAGNRGKLDTFALSLQSLSRSQPGFAKPAGLGNSC